MPMVDELALNQAAERAARAQRLTEDELLTEAFERLKEDYMAAWLGTAARDTDARERLWQAVQIVGKVRDHLGMVMAGGRLANRELAELAGRHGTFKA
jgi:hypothetical protein